MKQMLFAAVALIFFLLILQFGPNGIYQRDQAINQAIVQALASATPGEALAAASASINDPDPVATATATSTPPVDTDTTALPTASTPAAAQEAPVEVAASAPPAAPIPVPTPAAPPATETSTSTLAIASTSDVTPPPPAPTPAPGTVSNPEPSTPPPVAAITPLPQPAPAPVVTAPSAPTPTPSVEPTAATATVAAAVAPPAKKTKLYGPKVVILGYYRFIEPGSPVNPHRLTPEAFEKQMSWLHDNGYQVIALSDLVARLKTGAALPEHAAVITINNGYANAITLAAPILEKYNYPWSYLVYTDFIEKSPKAASWTNLLDLSAKGVEIGSQTKSHPWLTEADGKSAEQYDKWLSNELAGSRRTLEIKLNKPIGVLAYPYGNTNPTVQSKALAAGYEALLTTSGEPVTSATSPLSLGRLIQNQYTAPYFETILSQKDFTVSNAQPAAGALISDGHPTISAQLLYAGNINPKSVRAELSTGGVFSNIYDTATRTITFPVVKTLLVGPVIVVVKAKDQDTGKPIVFYWQFYYQPSKST